jgi:hypothetical protein
MAHEESSRKKAVTNPIITELVAFVADSASKCNIWLSKDGQVRTFFTENDSLANYLTQYFDHDQILSWYQSVDTNTLLDLSSHLDQLDEPYITHIDSLKSGCVSAINALAFSHDGNEALVLFVQLSEGREETFTLLLEQPQEGGWYIADTLSVFQEQN